MWGSIVPQYWNSRVFRSTEQVTTEYRLRIIPVSGKLAGNVEFTQRSAWTFHSSIHGTEVGMAVGLTAGQSDSDLT